MGGEDDGFAEGGEEGLEFGGGEIGEFWNGAWMVVLDCALEE